jgi:hypothetical protein
MAVPLRIVRGHATSPQAKGTELIAHICLDLVEPSTTTAN